MEVLGAACGADGTVRARRARRVLDPRRDRPRDRPRRPQARSPTDLRRVLSDVREAVEDWDEDAATPRCPSPTTCPPSPPAELRRAGGRGGPRAAALAGRRPLHLPRLPRVHASSGDDGDDVAGAPCPAPASASCAPTRSTAADESHPVSPSFDRLPADARAKAREHKLLVLTKANSRSTVHRPSYLDYIGVKKFDAEGNVIGERRFLGPVLLAPPTPSRCAGCRCVRRKVERGAGAARASRPTATTAGTCSQILETYPRDELFQTPADELRSIATSVLLPPGAPPAAAVPAPGRVRPLLLRPGLPAARPLHHRGPAAHAATSCRRNWAAPASTSPPGTPSRCCPGCTSWSASTAGTQLPELTDADVERIEARLVGRRPLLGGRLRRGARTPSAARSAPRS